MTEDIESRVTTLSLQRAVRRGWLWAKWAWIVVGLYAAIVIVIAIGVLQGFLDPRLGLIVPWLIVVGIVPAAIATLLTVVAFSQRIIGDKLTGPDRPKGRARVWLVVGGVIAAVFFGQDVFLAAFTSTGHPMDGMELVIGVGFILAVAVAVFLDRRRKAPSTSISGLSEDEISARVAGLQADQLRQRRKANLIAGLCAMAALGVTYLIWYR